MGKINVTVVNETENKKLNVTVSDELNCGVFIRNLVKVLGLPSDEDGAYIVYSLRKYPSTYITAGKSIRECDTLKEAEINDGDVVELWRVKNEKHDCSNCDIVISEKDIEKKIERKGGGFTTVLITLAFVFILGGMAGSCNYSSTDNSEICQVCHRSYTNWDDRKSIAMTNMCERCYENYKFKEKVMDEALKQLERE